MLDFIFSFWDFLVNILKPFTYDVRVGCLFTLVSAFLITLLSVGLSRMFIDVKLQREYATLLSEYRSLLNEARKTGDPKLLSKIKKRKAAVERIGSKVSAQSFKMLGVSMVVFLLLFNLIMSAFENRYAALILLFAYGDVTPLSPYIWYIICSFAFGRILFKIFGLEAIQSRS